MANVILQITNLSKFFGGLVAVNGVDLSVEKDDLVGIIGPNGAGKTTVFNLISGVYKPNKGKILFNSVNITNKPMNKIASYGIVRTFQSNVLFTKQTCLENVDVSMHLKRRSSAIRQEIKAKRIDPNAFSTEYSKMILAKIGLSSVEDKVAGNLPHGQKRLLGIANAIAADPELLLLDEPCTGMSAEDISRFIHVLNTIRESGVTIILVEHNIDVVLKVCERVVVLNFGEKIAEGLPDKVLKDEEVIKAYLGDDNRYVAKAHQASK